jgi:O-antigen/teichoic acid export membrane protein
MNQFLSGALAMATFVVGLFFLRYWRESRERLFLMFALAFWVLTVNWIGLGLLDPADESRTLLYVLRLAAFGLIIVAIVDKNRVRRPPPGP